MSYFVLQLFPVGIQTMRVCHFDFKMLQTTCLIHGFTHFLFQHTERISKNIWDCFDDENCTLLGEFRNGSQIFCTCYKNSQQTFCFVISCQTWTKRVPLQHKMVLECSYVLRDPKEFIYCPGWLSNKSEIMTYLREKTTLNRLVDRQTGGANSATSNVCTNVKFMCVALCVLCIILSIECP
jgi:hypothetical protein